VDKHHISICTDNKEKAHNTPFVNNEDKAPAKEISTHTAMSDNNNNVLLQTASTEIFSSSPSNKINARLLFDTGSQRSYMLGMRVQYEQNLLLYKLLGTRALPFRTWILLVLMSVVLMGLKY